MRYFLKITKSSFSKIIATVVITAVAIIYYNFNPSNYHFFPTCGFKQLTGLQCPGCGGQRAIYHLLHFQLTEAFIYNQLLVCSLPYLITWLLFENSFLKEKYFTFYNILFGNISKIIYASVIVLFWIGRNFIEI